MAGRFKGKCSGKPRVLAVDDEHLNLRLASLMLQKAGFEVDQATDGYQALELLEANHENYCMVTLDEVMPKMRGSEMLELWRKHEQKLKLPRVLVVMVTANGQLEDRVRYANCGADGLLIKPLNISKVGRELVDLLQYTWQTQGAGLDPDRSFGSLCNLHTTVSQDTENPVGAPLRGTSNSDACCPEPVPTYSGRSEHDTQATPPTPGRSMSGPRIQSDLLNGAQQQALDEEIKDNMQHRRRALLVVDGASVSHPQSLEKSNQLENLLNDAGFIVTVNSSPEAALSCIYEVEMPDIIVLRGAPTTAMQFAEAAENIAEMRGVVLTYMSEQRLDAATVCSLHLAGIHDVVPVGQLEDIELVAKLSRLAKLRRA